MAQIDIRNAIVRIIDGYVGIGAGAVNLMAGYAIGLNVIAVDLFTGAITTGDTVLFAGHTTVYTVTNHSETLSNTTSITLSPNLTHAIVDDEVVTVQPHSIEVTIGEGNCSYDEKRAFKYVRNRNVLDTVRQDQDEPVDVTVDATWEFLRAASGDPPTIEDAVKARGNASTWISSATDKCEPYAVDVQIEYDPPCPGVMREIITLQDFRYESFNHDLKMGTLAMKGKCNVTQATVIRET